MDYAFEPELNGENVEQLLQWWGDKKFNWYGQNDTHSLYECLDAGHRWTSKQRGRVNNPCLLFTLSPSND